MNDYGNDLPQDDEADGLPEGDNDAAGDGQGEDELAVLRRELDTLRASNTKLERDVKAGLGRFQSIVDRMEQGRGDPAALERQFNVQLAEVRGLLDAVLEDENLSPDVRQRAMSAAQQAKSRSELEDLKATLASIADAGQRQESRPSFDAQAFENEMVSAIREEELDPDDPVWDWAGQASYILKTQGEVAGRTYFRRKIAEVKAARLVDTRRQGRKQAASRNPDPQGGTSSPLDASRSQEERLKYLMEQGVLTV